MTKDKFVSEMKVDLEKWLSINKANKTLSLDRTYWFESFLRYLEAKRVFK
jgi:hypothetical protein